MSQANEADDALRGSGFTPVGEVSLEEADDENGSLGPPPRGCPRGGGIQIQARPQFNGRAVRVELSSCDEDTGCRVGFHCAHDMFRRVLYARLVLNGDADDEKDAAPQGANTERSTKGAINTLLDAAEACSAWKITVGLSAEQAGCAEFLCSLLYLGFQVVPVRKCPFPGVALMLDFDVGWQFHGGGRNSSDQTFTCTSDYSTSAEDNRMHDSSQDSD